MTHKYRGSFQTCCPFFPLLWNALNFLKKKRNLLYFHKHWDYLDYWQCWVPVDWFEVWEGNVLFGPLVWLLHQFQNNYNFLLEINLLDIFKHSFTIGVRVQGLECWKVHPISKSKWVYRLQSIDHMYIAKLTR